MIFPSGDDDSSNFVFFLAAKFHEIPQAVFTAANFVKRRRHLYDATVGLRPFVLKGTPLRMAAYGLVRVVVGDA